jgi:hypothetical protein
LFTRAIAVPVWQVIFASVGFLLLIQSVSGGKKIFKAMLFSGGRLSAAGGKT